jgi:hypothetical protein
LVPGLKKHPGELNYLKREYLKFKKSLFSLNDLKINGEDVMNTLNIPPGPLVGKILKEIFAKVEENKKLNTREKLLKLIKPTYEKLTN